MRMPLRIAVLAKQVPRFDELRLGADARLDRHDTEAEINPFCRRAIAKGAELAHSTGGLCTVFTLGPPQAADLLAEAIAWGADAGVLISDAAFAGSDTLATSRALAGAITRQGPFDLVLAGLNSVDGDTGQTPPQLAQLLDLPFLSGVRDLTIASGQVRARCERDDGYITAHLPLPALLTAAERLCPPAKVPPDERAGGTGRIQLVTAADLGRGPWGQDASPTVVGQVRLMAHGRRRARLSGPLAQQACAVAELINESAERLPRGAPIAHVAPPRAGTPAGISGSKMTDPVIAVIAEPGKPRTTQELLGASAGLAAHLGGRSTLLTTKPIDPSLAFQRGADAVIVFGTESVVSSAGEPSAPLAEDLAMAVAAWAREARPSARVRDSRQERPLPWAILAPSTSWGREVAGRLSVLLDAGLTGDAVGLEVGGERLVCWKPAFGGQLVAEVTARSAVQMATVRPGVLPTLRPREVPGAALISRAPLVPRGRVTISERSVNDEPERLAQASAIVSVGQGVDPSRYPELQPLLDVLDAELACTRKVTDAGSLPRSRQVGITGRAVAPAVYLLLGASGKFNHMVATRSAGLVVAVNSDPDAPVFDAVDVGVVADWAEFASLLVEELVSLGFGESASPALRR